jgi:hypothetical protein
MNTSQTADPIGASSPRSVRQAGGDRSTPPANQLRITLGWLMLVGGCAGFWALVVWAVVAART